MPPTMAEREAELAALQSAFDEYIASSRELEEELDAELAKMRKFLFNTFLVHSVQKRRCPTRSEGNVFVLASALRLAQPSPTFPLHLTILFDLYFQRRNSRIPLQPMLLYPHSSRTLHHNSQRSRRLSRKVDLSLKKNRNCVARRNRLKTK
jgi:hypothetical protein